MAVARTSGAAVKSCATLGASSASAAGRRADVPRQLSSKAIGKLKYLSSFQSTSLNILILLVDVTASHLGTV